MQHFKSSLALKQHVQAIMTTVITRLYLLTPLRSGDRSLLLSTVAQQEVTDLFACAESQLDASEKTVAGYRRDLMNIGALCNVEQVMVDVITNPADFKLCPNDQREERDITAWTVCPSFLLSRQK
jgi:hypothetical protein